MGRAGQVHKKKLCSEKTPPVWCEPCVVGEKPSAHRRLGTAPGSLGKVARAVLAPCVSCDVADATSQDTHAAAPPNRSSTLGRHWAPTADRPDAFEDRCSTSLAVAHLRNDDHPAQPHGIVTTLKRWACGWEPYRLVWFQTASSIEACSDHV